MENLEKYHLTSDKLDVSHWNSIWNYYMFPQNDGTLQFGMGVNELYCLGSYLDHEDLADKVVSFDMSLILRPAMNLLIRTPREASIGPGNPGYMLYFYDDGNKITVKLSRWDDNGAESAVLAELVDLTEIIDLWDYNHYEIAVLNEGENVHFMVAVNGKSVIDCVDEAPGETYQKPGKFFFQGGHSIVRLRGTDSDVPSAIAKPVKTGEVKGVGMYDVSAVETIDTRIMSTITTPRSFVASNGFTVNYRIYLPAHYDPAKKYSLQMHLHGGGLRGSDNMTQLMGDFNQLNMLVQYQKQEEFIFIVPECPIDRFWADSQTYNAAEGQYYINISGTAESTQVTALMELLGSLAKEFSVDENRLYLSGASMGGFASYDIVSRYPQTFAAAFIGCAASDLTVVEALAKTPLYIAHGGADAIIPVQNSRNMDAAFKALGIDNYVYVEYEGRGHDFTTMPDLLAAMKWLHSKTR
ncbi:MAG: prolyl oligopeptidase family serine peptidase [Clostridia bacterium]|nr:prolyl oligopeptidase family serine peptidase [Clostridia bacterium]